MTNKDFNQLVNLILKKLYTETLVELANGGTWPITKMAGPEVYPERSHLS